MESSHTTTDTGHDGSRLPRPATITVLALIVAVLFAGGAIAAHDANTIHACVHQQHGTMRMVETEADCKPSEDHLSWNIVGPQGPQGPQGPEGESGVIGHLFIESEAAVVAPGEMAAAQATCPAGKVVTGGGPWLHPFWSEHAAVVKSHPGGGGLVTISWAATVRNVGSETFSFRVRALCVDG